jgi:hypothetical protein
MPTMTPMMRLWFFCAALILSAAAPAAALQGGSLPLTDVIALAKPYPNLLLQIRLELVRANTTRDKVVCTADRLDGNWKRLSAARVGPYACTIGRRTLTVATKPTYYDERGYKLSPRAPDLGIKAVRVEETNLKWSWK